MSELFEETVELERDDGVRLAALRITPDWDEAERGRGAGVVVLAGGALTDDHVERVARPLAHHGLFVVGLGLGGDTAAAVDDLHAALLSVKALARGRVGVVAIDGTGGAALEAATGLPHLDAVVHASGGLPTAARLRRIRAAILILHAERGGAITDGELARLTTGMRDSRASLTIYRHPVATGLFDGPLAALSDDDRHQAAIAWAQTRDFLTNVLT